MKKVILTRYKTSDEGTLSTVVVIDHAGTIPFRCVGLELPWRLNARNRSCVLPGSYPLRWRFSPSHGRNVYHVENTPGRSEVELHPANLAGDVDKGYAAQVLGCGALGELVQTFKQGAKVGQFVLTRDQQGVTNSVATVRKFEEVMGGEAAEIEIKWMPGAGPA